METFQEKISNFTNILSQSIQMMTASFNPNPLHFQAPYHQQTGSRTQNFTDVGKVNHYQDLFYQHNKSVNLASSFRNSNQNIIDDGEKQYTDLSQTGIFYIVFYEESFCFLNKET